MRIPCKKRRCYPYSTLLILKTNYQCSFANFMHTWVKTQKVSVLSKESRREKLEMLILLMPRVPISMHMSLFPNVNHPPNAVPAPTPPSSEKNFVDLQTRQDTGENSHVSMHLGWNTCRKNGIYLTLIHLKLAQTNHTVHLKLVVVTVTKIWKYPRKIAESTLLAEEPTAGGGAWQIDGCRWKKWWRERKRGELRGVRRPL